MPTLSMTTLLCGSVLACCVLGTSAERDWGRVTIELTADDCYVPGFVECCCCQHHLGCDDGTHSWSCPPAAPVINEAVEEPHPAASGWEFNDFYQTSVECKAYFALDCGTWKNQCISYDTNQTSRWCITEVPGGDEDCGQ